MPSLSRKSMLVILFIIILMFPLIYAIPLYIQHSQKDVLRRVADYTMSELDYSIFTDWGKGICVHGLIDAYNATGDEKYLSFARYWTDQSIRTQTVDGEFGHGELTSGDSTAIGQSVLYFYEKTNDTVYLDAAIKNLDYLRSPDRIWVDGGHLTGGSSHLKNRPELWIDHLFMVVPFWAQLGVILNNSDYVNESVHQIFKHLEHLLDPATNLTMHIWSETVGYKDPNIWARGIGWATAAIARTLDIIPETHANYTDLRDVVLDMLVSLETYQDPSGLWPTIVNDTNTFLETSGATLYAYTVAKLYNINASWITSALGQMAEDAFNAVVQKVDAFGVVHWCTGGTQADPHSVPPADYAIPWGQGLFLSMYREFHELNWLEGVTL